MLIAAFAVAFVNSSGPPTRLATPPPQDVIQYYPERARRLEKQGDVQLRCSVSKTYRLDACGVTAESPGGFGFGDAALKLSHNYTIAADARVAGAAPGAEVQLVIPFRLKP